MKGDFSRQTFEPTRHYAQVLMQQGRVLLDADWNEQTAILLHYLRTLAADLIGPHGGPAWHLGFAIRTVLSNTTPPRLADLAIGPGRYYVDGILCETGTGSSYADQPDWIGNSLSANGDLKFPLLVYLDVWERHVNSIEDPHISEVALGGPDTASRAKVVWQVHVLEVTAPPDLHCETFRGWTPWTELVDRLQPPNRGRLAAKAKSEDVDATNPCVVSPEARYRGAENQLYRAEIHQSGPAGTATFKWSRENGSVVFSIESIAAKRVTLETLGRDARFGLEVGDWVEVVAPDSESGSERPPSPLLQVEEVDPVGLTVTLSAAPTPPNPQSLLYLRRWDHREGDPQLGGLKLHDGAAFVETLPTNDKWLNLEDGVQILFAGNGTYRHGDYWLIPARTATGNVEWPEDNGGMQALLPPHGVQHHYAPLAMIKVNPGDNKLFVTDLRHIIDPLATCCPKVIVHHPATLAKGTARIQFTAELSHPVENPTYHWITNAGKITAANPPNRAVVEEFASLTHVTATVTVQSEDCTVSASGTCVILP